MRFGLRSKFLAPTLSLVAVGMVAGVVFAYFIAKSALEEQSKHELASYASSLATSLDSWVERGRLDIQLWSQQDMYRSAIPDSFIGRSAREAANAQLKSLRDKYEVYEILNLANEKGDVIASSKKDTIGRINESDRAYFKQCLKGESVMSGIINSKDTGRPGFVLATPVKEQNTVIGVILGVVDLASLSDMFFSKFKAGETGFAYLFDSTGKVIAHPNKDLILKADLPKSDHGKLLLVQKQDGGSKSDKIIAHNDEKGRAMLTALKTVGNKGWTVAVTAPQAEIFKSAKTIRNTLIFLTLVVMAALGFGLWLMSERFIIRPVNKVVAGLKDIAEGDGDLTTRLAVHTQDEVGELARWFNLFIEKLQTMMKGLTEGAATLASSTSQISSASSEFATNSLETSRSVSEITTTAEEVKQTVQISTDKAEAVAYGAERVSEVAAMGRKVTEEAVAGMARIKEEMEYIAESILKLSEHTQSIGEIIGAVNDIANQSNLLSVNASIEAAKAGEYGKGFAVVAQEVKSLSDGSKVATNQVRTILNEIQKATGAAVMATERGAKAVEAGLALSSQAGEAIAALARNVGESVLSATQIAASSRQQMAGMDQLVDAMDSIRIGTQNNAAGARQLEESSRNLADLGETISALVGRFKV
jgi:methyl-accepting chemotaxis protein